jgi:hypothetical protein
VPHPQTRRRWQASDVVAHAKINIEAISRLVLKLRVIVGSPREPDTFTMERHPRGATRHRLCPRRASLVRPTVKEQKTT